MKTAIAQSNFSITVYCPYCNQLLEKTYILKSCLIEGDLSAKECDTDVNCIYCHRIFMVTDIEF